MDERAWDESAWDDLRQSLDAGHCWPCAYLFKFIVPSPATQQVIDLFPGMPVDVRPSRHGRYMSVSAEVPMHTSEEVVMVYQRASGIPGVISL